ncbi:MAG: diacylglycerol kinase [Methylophilaceae bacterium]|jgi:diacylglycerol kinase (ATP)
MESPFKGKTGIKRLINAFGYSLSGFKVAFAKEDAFRQEVFLSIILVTVAVYISNSSIELVLLIGSTLLVPIIELLNSAIEATVDRVSLDKHPLAKRAKDIGSAAVFLSLVNLAATWLIIIFY